jgi:hypothetical protein
MKCDIGDCSTVLSLLEIDKMMYVNDSACIETRLPGSRRREWGSILEY